MAEAENSSSESPRAGGPTTVLAGLTRLLVASDRRVAAIGVLAFLAGTIPGLPSNADLALTLISIAVALFFALQYVLVLYRTADRFEWMGTAHAIIDLCAALPIPVAVAAGAPGETARLFGVFWALKLIRMNPAFALLGRVLRNEKQALLSVTTAFFVVVLFASTLAFVFERHAQPEVFGSVPAALWWAVTTITTTGYGDKVPVTLAGRALAGIVMVAGIGLFALWAGILASGFAQELRRRDFLESWDLVVRLPLFRNLGAAALAEVARLLKAQNCPTDAVIVKKGQPGDSMYFIAEGEVEVRAPSLKVRLLPGQFFGEAALISGAPRNATVVAVTPTRLLRLDVIEFRGLAERQPELLQIIRAEDAKRETMPQR